mmetsp:Transcript_19636/g.30288  ORF Transcript_19636/g.30288 Transcript_19636/m.30288 type:complete len:156 (+) Transcript_19636:292-759(+)
MMKQIFLIADDFTREKKMKEHIKVGKCMKTDVHSRERILTDLEEQLVVEALKLPNKTHPDTPIGDEGKNRILRQVDPLEEVKGVFRNEEIGCTHMEIAQMYDLVDFNSASKLTGNKFVFLKNEAAQLELALSSWVMNKVARKGFTAVLPPELARQ